MLKKWEEEVQHICMNELYNVIKAYEERYGKDNDLDYIIVNGEIRSKKEWINFTLSTEMMIETIKKIEMKLEG